MGGLQHLFYADNPALARIQNMCQEYQTGFHTHSNESQFDVGKSKTLWYASNSRLLERVSGMLDVPQMLTGALCLVR